MNKGAWFVLALSCFPLLSGCGNNANNTGSNAAGFSLNTIVGARSQSHTAGIQTPAASDPNPTASRGWSQWTAAPNRRKDAAEGIRQWTRVNSAAKTMDLKITAHGAGSQSPSQSRLGATTVVLPPGWTVDVSLQNTGGARHSLIVVPFNHRLAGGTVGSARADTSGTVAPSSKQHFVFKARTPGQYALVCTTQGHQDGIYDTVVVSKTASTAIITSTNRSEPSNNRFGQSK